MTEAFVYYKNNSLVFDDIMYEKNSFPLTRVSVKDEYKENIFAFVLPEFIVVEMASIEEVFDNIESLTDPDQPFTIQYWVDGAGWRNIEFKEVKWDSVYKKGERHDNKKYESNNI
jgi:hypothetical protein